MNKPAITPGWIKPPQPPAPPEGPVSKHDEARDLFAWLEGYHAGEQIGNRDFVASVGAACAAGFALGAFAGYLIGAMLP